MGCWMVGWLVGWLAGWIGLDGPLQAVSMSAGRKAVFSRQLSRRRFPTAGERKYPTSTATAAASARKDLKVDQRKKNKRNQAACGIVGGSREAATASYEDAATALGEIGYSFVFAIGKVALSYQKSNSFSYRFQNILSKAC